MDKKEARKILGVSKEISKNDLERKFTILLKKHRMVQEMRGHEEEAVQNPEKVQQSAVQQDAGIKQEEYTFEQITQAYNVLMGYEVPMKEEPPSKAAPLLKKAGIDEKKAKNFFYYYKYHILISIIAIVTIVFTVRGCVNRVDPDFTIAFLGEISYTDNEVLKASIKQNVPEILEPGFDGAFISENGQGEQQYAMVMKATVLMAAGDVDIFILDKACYDRYAKQGAFISLDDIALDLGVDMEKNKEYILSVEESGDISDEASEEQTVKEPEPEHLYGIDITHSTALKESGIIGNEMIAALYVRGEQKDKAVKLLRFLLK